ncbi:uncharacterized protein I303_105467 [Kwoniella dejecticola CBS 10117]|uniref:Uncharacterized protein n=1 Tax=Kwoniella dejecticola CBS 10117 TaxID=1296121 RepID=A0A1A6A2G0_9TREE|nr:uncharacterized protein I303_05091 [Kwoniella dejecticola CBS 10117]OBR84234.1 hypothetical protein I303_05091 [Kwoniella dejecticola CBS 10117]
MDRLTASRSGGINDSSLPRTTQYQATLPDPTVRDVFATDTQAKPQRTTSINRGIYNALGANYQIKETLSLDDILTLKPEARSLVERLFGAGESIKRMAEHKSTMTCNVYVNGPKPDYASIGRFSDKMRDHEGYLEWLKQTSMTFTLDDEEEVDKYGCVVPERADEDYVAGEAHGICEGLTVYLDNQPLHDVKGQWTAYTSIQRDDCTDRLTSRDRAAEQTS